MTFVTAFLVGLGMTAAAAAATISIAMTVASMAYQQSRMRKMRAELDKRKQVAVAVDGEPFYLGIIYGRASVSGGKTKHLLGNSYIHSNAVGNSQAFATGLGETQGGSKSEFLFVQQAVCYGGIEDVVDITVNDKNWNDSSYNQQRIHFYKDGGVADPMASSNGILNSNYFTNTAYASMCFKLNREEYNYNGSPNVTFFVKGMRIRDILFDGTNYSVSTTKSYSNNPARVLLDYLTSPVYGKGLDLSLIDLKTFYDAKVICDRVVNPSAAQDGRVNGRRPDIENASGSVYTYPPLANKEVRLYECNVVLDSERAIRENIELILESMEEAELVWSGGIYKLKLDAPTSELEQRALVVAELTDNDIINDQISLEFPDSSSRYNQAVVRFMNEFENFVDDTVTWPETYSSVYSQYLEEDSGILLKTEIYLPCTSDPYHAQAKAEQLVRTSRREMRVNFRVGKIGLSLEPGDIISVTSPSSGLDQELLKIEAVKLSQDLTAEISARQYDYETFAWNVPDYIPYFSQKIDYYYKVIPPVNVVFTPDNGNGLFGITSGRLTWTYPDTISVSEFVVELSNDNGATWQTLTSSLATVFDITGLNNGVYQFSVRSKDQSGRLSDRVIAEDSEGTQFNFTIQRATADQVAVVYANNDNVLTNTQSYSLGANEYVAYYVYSGDLPTLPIRTGISFSKFVGAEGLPGVDGIDGQPGANGADGNTVAQLQIFRRSATALTTPTGGSYNFDTGALTPPSGWSTSVPSGSDPLYSSVTIASIVGTSGTDSSLTWSLPSILAQNGATGADGLNTAVVSLFNKNTSGVTPPASFTGTFTYTFTTSALSGGTLNGWSTSAPTLTSGEFLWVRQAVASSASNTDTISIGEWSSAVVTAYVGEDGVPGSNGLNSRPLFLYRKTTSTTAPTSFTGTATYTFSTDALTGLVLNSWTRTAPSLAKGEYLWMRQAIASSNTNTDTIAIGEWSASSIIGVAGEDGLNGDSGKSVYTAIVFQRNGSTPATPTGGSFNFGTNTLTPPSGWFLDVPSGTTPAYGARFVFSIIGDTGTQTATTWSTPFKIAEDGIDGIDGQSGADGISTFQISVYRRGATVPATPTGGSYNFGTQVVTPPSGWLVSPAAGSDPLYISTTLASVQGVTGIDSTLSWSTPAKFVENGANGVPGANNAVVSLYNKNTSSVTPPASFTGTATYTFATGAVTGLTFNGWSTTPPNLSAGEYLWVRQAVASSANTTDTIAIGEWATAVVTSYLGEDGTPGTNGLNSRPLFLYRKNTSTTAPTSFSGTATYTFSTDSLTGLTLNSWTRTAPSLAAGEYLWVRQATASSNTNTDTIAIGEWSASAIVGIGGADGSPGVDGVNGSNTAVVSLFNKNTSSTTPPAAFSGTGTYTFSTNNLAGMTLNGWTRSVPTIAKGEYLWVRQATATSTSPSDNIAIGEWSAAVVLSAGGIDGLKAVPIFLYAKNTSTTAPASFTGTATYNFTTDALTGLTLNGWSRTAPGLGKGEYLWVRQATASGTNTTDTILIGEWSTARILSAGGVDGIGARGPGWWYWDAGVQDLSGVDTTAEVNVFWEAAQGTGFDPVVDDVFVIYTSHPSGTKSFVYNGVDWVSQAAFVDGNLLVAGTVRSQAIATSAITSDKIEANAVTADKIDVINLSAISANIGTFSSAASGERVVIEDDRISVFDASNNLRVRIGRL